MRSLTVLVFFISCGLMMFVIRDGEWNLDLLLVNLRYKYCSSIENVILLISGKAILTRSAGR